MRTRRSGGTNSTDVGGISRRETLADGVVPLIVSVGAWGSEVGFGSLAETWQQEPVAGASANVDDGP